jgi:hypothetical protein
MIKLCALLPATMGAPESPPLKNESRVSIENPPLSLPLPWHFTQAASKIGFTSRAKFTRTEAGGGSLAICSGVSFPCAEKAPANASSSHAEIIRKLINRKSSDRCCAKQTEVCARSPGSPGLVASKR